VTRPGKHGAVVVEPEIITDTSFNLERAYPCHALDSAEGHGRDRPSSPEARSPAKAAGRALWSLARPRSCEGRAREYLADRIPGSIHGVFRGRFDRETRNVAPRHVHRRGHRGGGESRRDEHPSMHGVHRGGIAELDGGARPCAPVVTLRRDLLAG